MLDILYFLLALSAILTGAVIFRLTRSARAWRRSGIPLDGRASASQSFDDDEMHQADWDLRFIRWMLGAWTITVFWALATGAAFLVAAALA